MKQSNKRTIIFVISSLLLLVGGLALAIRLGSVHITFSDIWNSIFNTPIFYKGRHSGWLLFAFGNHICCIGAFYEMQYEDYGGG